MTEKYSKRLIDDRIINITEGYPVDSGDDYIKLSLDLFRAGVYRIPIIGTKVGSNIITLMLISTDIQEHAQLGKEIELNPSDIVYTSSIEGLPSNDIDPFAFYLHILASNEDIHQRFGRGSDYYSPSLNNEGLKELTRIFAHIGSFARV